MQNKGLIFIIGMVLIIGILGFFYAKNEISATYKAESVMTKAICDEENYCEDYQIQCEGKKLVGLNPTGAAIQFSESWKDPRSEDDKEINCN